MTETIYTLRKLDIGYVFNFYYYNTEELKVGDVVNIAEQYKTAYGQAIVTKAEAGDYEAKRVS